MIHEASALLLKQKTKVNSTIKEQHLSRMDLDDPDDMFKVALPSPSLSLAPSASSSPAVLVLRNMGGTHDKDMFCFTIVV